MKDDSVFSPLELKDALFKTEIYLSRIVKGGGSFGQIQKVCHLAAETCIKFCQKEEFAKDIYNKLYTLIKEYKNYFLFYLLDTLMKNSRFIIKIARKDLEQLFKLVWEQLYTEQKNQLKIQCLKAMVKTWSLLFADKIYESLQQWVKLNYNTGLELEKKNEELFNQIAERYKFYKQSELVRNVEFRKAESDKI